MTTGLPWRDGGWFVGQVDRIGVLTEPEQTDVRERGDQWAQRTIEGEVDGDLYAASWAIVAALRERLHVEYREAPRNVEPVDLDALNNRRSEQVPSTAPPTGHGTFRPWSARVPRIALRMGKRAPATTSSPPPAAS